MATRAAWEKYEDQLLNKGLSQKRIAKLRALYSMVTDDLRVPLEKAERKDFEDYVRRLHRGDLKSRYGTPYSGSTKADLKRFIRAYIKWLRTDDEYYPPEVRWIKTQIAKDEQPEEKEIVTHEEVVKLANSFEKQHMKYITLLLFDSGFRIQELLSVKKKDLTFDVYDGDKKCFWLSCNESKTEKRRIPLLLFEEDYRDFVNSTYVQGKDAEDALFPYGYNAVLRGLKRRADAILKKKLTPHTLRHSSATYYAKEYDGNSMLLAERYGWTYSSDQLKRYIRRSGAYQRAGAKKVYENEVVKLRSDLRQREGELDALKAQVEAMAQTLARIETPENLRAALALKRRAKN